MFLPNIIKRILHFTNYERFGRSTRCCVLLFLTAVPLSMRIEAAPLPRAENDSVIASSTYQLGSEDSLLIRIKDEPEIPAGPYQIDLAGDITIPEIGTIHAMGMTVASFTQIVTERGRRILHDPVVTVSVAEYHSQRVSILGAVQTPGVQQIRGRKTLYEVVSEAGGLKPDAGGSIRLSRKVEEGPLPLPGAVREPNGRFETAEIDVESMMKAESPQANIAIRPDDVITVPKAELVYVLGAVRRPGGFPLNEKQTMTVMQALSLAQGVERTAGTKHARLLSSATDGTRKETAINLSKVIAGKEPDTVMRPNDILVVPNSNAKAASIRALEALVNTGSGLAIYHPY